MLSKVCPAAAVLGLSSAALAQPSFTPLGDLPGGQFLSAAMGVSGDVTTDEEGDYIAFGDLEFTSAAPVKIEGGKTFTTVMLGDGTLWCWGDNRDDTDYPCTLPTDGDGTYLDFSAKHHHGAAISTCYADADGDGDVADADKTFFQTLLASQDIGADCNQSGTLSLTDWWCFYNLWTQGCD